MAISKILHMKDSGNSFHARHLKRALDYVMNPEKTQGGRLVGAINCQADMAFEQMMDTKKQFGKTDKRQGYHIILSFKEDEVEPDRAFEITQKFVAEYLGDAYEAVFVVHDNTDHVHSHIVFNSVSFVDGKKYRYEKGDWAKYIQPITNKLCQEYGLSIIDVEDGSKEKQHENYKDWSEYREGSFVWADMIKRDFDACILQANDFSGFLELLSEKGYEVKQGKYLAVRPQGMTRFRRCKTLGENYSQEAIVERIAKEDLSFYQSQNEERQAAIVKCYVKRYRRAKMSGLQKRYYAKLYRIGKLKKKHQRKRVRPIRLRKDSKIFLTRLNRSGGLMMRNRVIRVGIPFLKMSTMHGKGLTLSFWHRDTVWKRSRVLEKNMRASMHRTVRQNGRYQRNLILEDQYGRNLRYQLRQKRSSMTKKQ